jgi:hypothetical protein
MTTQFITLKEARLIASDSQRGRLPREGRTIQVMILGQPKRLGRRYYKTMRTRTGQHKLIYRWAIWDLWNE